MVGRAYASTAPVLQIFLWYWRCTKPVINFHLGMPLVANFSPNSGRQHLFSVQKRADSMPNSGFLTSRKVCRGKSDT